MDIPTKITNRRPSRRCQQTPIINISRWTSYAAAAATTTLGCAASADANIIYSGPIDRHFSGNQNALFPLAAPGTFLVGYHHNPGDGVSYGASFSVRRTAAPFGQGSIAGLVVPGSFGGQYASKLRFGQNISTRPFVPRGATLASDGPDVPNAQWQEPGTGFLGFRFTGPLGVQFGWARIDFTDSSHHDFTLIDYAFASPGERIKAGQTSESVPDSGGSLGLLALGCAGLLAWRARRQQAEAS